MSDSNVDLVEDETASNDLAVSVSDVMFGNSTSTSLLMGNGQCFPCNLEAYQVTNDIIRCRIHRDTCLFLSIYNAIRCPRQRYVLSHGNAIDPCRYFVEFIQKCPKDISYRVAKEGYNFIDVFNYLVHLRNIGLIRHFKWRRFRYESRTDGKKPRKRGKKSFNITNLYAAGQMEPIIYILFGVGVATDKRIVNKTSAMYESLSLDQSNGPPLTSYCRDEIKLKCAMYDQSSKDCKIVRVEFDGKLVKPFHGVALARENDGRIYLYDDGHYRRRLASLLELRNSVVDIYSVAQFDIVL